MMAVVFIGPTLAAKEALALLPGATIRPPAACGDILDLVESKKKPDCIALVDGYFERMAAPWHKEILLALEAGIAVCGASSMGAIRAAELAPFGMIGVGAIYKQFATGVLTADDEVAVAHLPAAQGYRGVSDALVNIRHGLDLGVTRRLIKPAQRTSLLERAISTFYRDRSWDAMIAGAPALAVVAREELDLKASDARVLLTKLRTQKLRRPKRLTVPRTWALRRWIEIR